jgi:hypothetical protein
MQNVRIAELEVTRVQPDLRLGSAPSSRRKGKELYWPGKTLTRQQRQAGRDETTASLLAHRTRVPAVYRRTFSTCQMPNYSG